MDFNAKSVSINRRIIRVAAVFVLIVELVNMLRVLFLSSSGLGTLNNRVYFGFYLAYFLGGAAFLFIDIGLKPSVKARYYIYLLCGSFMLLWHTLFNIYDVYRAGAAGNFTIISAMAFFCCLFVMKPGYALGNLGVSYLLFVLFLGRNFSSGEVINYTITAGLFALIYLARYKHLCVELSQAQMINDIHHELTETQQSFRLSIEQYEMIRERGSYVNFEWDLNADQIRFSEEWTAWFDTPKVIPHFERAIGTSQMLPPEQKEILQGCLEGIKKGIPFQRAEVILRRKDGEEAWFELRVITQMDEHDKPAFGIGMLSDITDQKEKMRWLEQETQMDLFTGLLNKNAIERYGERKLKELKKGETLSMLILDVDKLKSINDDFGHPVGDYVLKRVADVLRKKMPPGAEVGRIGGDEFIALLPMAHGNTLMGIAEELIEEISLIRWQDKDVGASCSIGISTADSSQWTYSQLYKTADDALYQAKRRGRRQACEWQRG